MALDSVDVSSGTGITVLTDLSGTANAQIVKVVQGADGTFNFTPWTVAMSGTANVSVVNTAAVTVASITTGTVNVANTVVISGSVTALSLTTGTVNVANTVAISGTADSISLPYSTVVSGRITVTSAGGSIALTADSVAVKAVRVMGLPTNTATVVWGGSGVVASSGSQNGMLLFANQQSDDIRVDNLNELFISASNSGEGVSYVYFN